jgi:uncharacterized protein (TIGR04255 family)
MSLFPFAGAHAVQSAAFAFEWPQHLTDADFASVLALHDKLSKSLPTVVQNKGLTIDIASGTTSAAQAIGSVTFSRSALGAAGAPSRILEIARDRCVGLINEYTRWEPVWKEVLGWFEVVAPALVAGHPVKHIGLQYNDLFHWRASPESLDLKRVFRAQSPFLPPNVFELKDLWHSHHGYFKQREEPMAHRLLENINVNLVDELGQRSILISTVHKAEFSTPIFTPEDLLATLRELIPDLHMRNKEILGKLLADETVELIKLFDKEAKK